MREASPAGWYPQPDGRLRYWDGTGWTERYRSQLRPQQRSRPEPTPFSQAAADAVRRLVSWFAGLSSTPRIAVGVGTALVLVVGIDLSALPRPDASYLSTLRRDSWFADQPDSNLLNEGHNTCAALENGNSLDAMIGAAERIGIPARQEGQVIAAATKEFCPSYLPQTQQWLARNTP